MDSPQSMHDHDLSLVTSSVYKNRIFVIISSPFCLFYQSYTIHDTILFQYPHVSSLFSFSLHPPSSSS